MRLAIPSLILFVYVSASLVLALPYRPWAKAAAGGLLLAVCLKYVVYEQVGGSFFAPDLPRPLLLSMEALYATVVILFFLLFIKDGVAVVLWLTRLLGSSWGLPFSPAVRSGGVVLTAMAMATFGTWQSVRVPEVRTVEVTLPKLPRSLDGFRIVQLSDIHIGPLLKGDWLRGVVQKTNALEPDLIALTGDMVDGDLAERRTNIAPLADLRARHGVYGVTGNHEYYFDAGNWVPHFESLGITMLHNDHRSLSVDGSPLVIAGIPDPADARFGGTGPDARRALHGAPEAVRVLLAHQPSARGAEAGADLQLSGHTHGGLLFFLKWLMASFNGGLVMGRYDGGAWPSTSAPAPGYGRGSPVVSGSRRRSPTWSCAPRVRGSPRSPWPSASPQHPTAARSVECRRSGDQARIQQDRSTGSVRPSGRLGPADERTTRPARHRRRAGQQSAMPARALTGGPSLGTAPRRGTSHWREETIMKSRMSRRSLLKAGAAAVGTLAVGSLPGFGSALGSTPEEARVFFTPDISGNGLLKVYSEINRGITGRVAIKVHTGEPNGPNILPRNMVKALQQRIPDSRLVETNTLYKGKRFTTADHRETIQINGWDFCPVDILDEDGAAMIPVRGGKHFTEMSVGKHLLDYDSMVVLTHFKGHAMGGFGGSLKNIAIGCVDGPIGKKMVHAAPDNDDYASWPQGEPFQENMVESAKAISDHFGKGIVYINVLRNMSVDCDCAGTSAAPPKTRDVGILASTDLLAIDQASIDLVYALPEEEAHDLKERIESRKGLRQLSYMKELKMGSDRYQLITV